jgi:hypothetical protein
MAIAGTYPDHLIEQAKDKAEIRHAVNEALTRPWLKHYFLTQVTRETNTPEDILARDTNLLELFKTTIPLPENSFGESSLSAWRMFLDSSMRDADTPWYSGIRKILVRDRFHWAIEQLEIEMPLSNTQRTLQFYDQGRVLRKIPRIPVKLFFALPGNEKESLLQIIRLAVKSNPHNVDIALLAYCFMKAWDRASDFFQLAEEVGRIELEEWFYWVEHSTRNLGAIKRAAGDSITTFYIYERALLAPFEYREVADWFMKENEFKSAYHFYYKAKEFETALDLLQNISTKEFADLTNMRRIARGEKPFDINGDTSPFATLYQEENETLRGFARIRTAETYKHVAVKARQHFDRETIETKYAFGELSDEEYQRLIRQLQERKQ